MFKDNVLADDVVCREVGVEYKEIPVLEVNITVEEVQVLHADRVSPKHMELWKIHIFCTNSTYLKENAKNVLTKHFGRIW